MESTDTHPAVSTWDRMVILPPPTIKGLAASGALSSSPYTYQPIPSSPQETYTEEEMKVLLGICLVLSLAVLSSARRLSHPYSVTGRVYCDTCRTGFETPITSYIPGAKVRLECRHRDSQELLYSAEGITDAKGTYKILVDEDQGERMCDAVLVSSPLRACGKPDPGRDRSRVTLTSYNGMTSTERYANALGFVQEYSLAACTRVLQQYQLDEDEI